MNQFTPMFTIPGAVAPSSSPAEPVPRIAVVASGWHREIVLQATAAIADEFAAQLQPPLLEQFEVPGAFEIPLHVQRLARSGRYAAVIACGLIVNGGIYRHEFVSSAVIDGLMRVQLESDVPVFSAVLTPRDFHEHADHLQFFTAHFVKKGSEVAQTCLQTLAGLAALPAVG